MNLLKHMSSFSVTTTWGSKHWDYYGRRCVESIIKHWPGEVKKIFYVDDMTQSIQGQNIEYYRLQDTQPKLQEFIDRNKDNQYIKERMRAPLRDVFEYDAVRFSWKVFCMIDAASRCNTDRLIFVDADTVTYKNITMQWLEHIAPGNKFTSFLGRPKKGFSETGFITFNLSLPHAKKFFARWQEYYDKDLWKDLKGFTDSFTYDAARIDTTPRYLDNDLNDGRYLGSRSAKHPFVNSELGDYMDHLKGDRKDAKNSAKDSKVKRKDDHWV